MYHDQQIESMENEYDSLETKTVLIYSRRETVFKGFFNLFTWHFCKYCFW